MKIEKKNIPLPATAAKHTSEIKTVEELYFNGLHIELIMLLPNYYEEALRHEREDICNNNAIGLWYLRKGLFAKQKHN